jgi:hypothetical protein
MVGSWQVLQGVEKLKLSYYKQKHKSPVEAYKGL